MEVDDVGSLHYAAEEGNLDEVVNCIAMGISVDCVFIDDTPLHYAAHGGQVEVAEFLIKNKCDIDAKNGNGQTALEEAIEFDQLGVIELLVQSGADMKCCDKDGWTALQVSSHGGHFEATEYFIRLGFDVNAKNNRGETPLMWTFCAETATLLLQAGADVKCCSENGWTALHFCASKENVDRCYELYGCKEHYFYEDVYCHEACNNEQKVMELLLESGSDMNARNADGETPLILAAYNGNKEAATLLIRFGANLHAKDNRGKTALTRALEFKDFESNPDIVLGIITLFIESGAYIDTEEYMKIYRSSFLRDSILGNVRLCTQAIINKVENVYLPTVYSLHGNRLPSMERLMKLMSENVSKDIENSVSDEIKTKSFCNVLELRPKNLQLLTIMSLAQQKRYCKDDTMMIKAWKVILKALFQIRYYTSRY